ncbi:MAG TPA: aminotransferase class I/II-fold pyridoxal phosphate-dependent enzyme [Candidatus Saccharimonadia bacterium]|nr:aminotransferase class I/II-fold pyridoxal phosphate-dependent enzyme [Candidatus Saccharimonadia bacterium]
MGKTRKSEATMLDFTSALYLGLRHPSETLQPWAQLTTGRPAALQAPPGAESITASLARLLRCEGATLGTSTLHIFWDVFKMLATEPIGIYIDAGTYPIARWGVERVSAQGVPTANFQRHDSAALADLLRRNQRFNRRPVVVTDGLCPATGRTAPIIEYLNLIRARGGYLVIDDTQALGILGHHPGPAATYGWGGGGTPAWHGIQVPELIVGSSLAKGFGVPLAVLAGSKCLTERFEHNSATSMHCSPPSVALIHAAAHALTINESRGEHLRWRLVQLVQRFRERLQAVGLAASGGLFPVQTLQPIAAIDAARLHSVLQGAGVETVLHRPRHGLAARISFLLTASHRPEDIDRAVALLANIVAQQRPRQRIKVGHHA